MNNKFSLFVSGLILSFLPLIIHSNNIPLKAEEITENVNNSHESSHKMAKNQDADVEYMTNLALMKGHLIVGKELLLLRAFIIKRI